MKKRSKTKVSKTDMPDLVTAMMKLVERLEALEKKTDQMFGRLSNLPSDVRRAVQEIHPPQPYRPAPPAPRPGQGTQSQPNHGPHERILYQAVCADCCKRCEVPFKPSGDRPVYCPACFAIRKAGHVPKDLTSHVVVPRHLREAKTASAGANKTTVAPKGKKRAQRFRKNRQKRRKNSAPVTVPSFIEAVS